MKDKIKVIFKVLEWDFNNKVPIPKFVVEEWDLFFDEKTGIKAFFNPKGLKVMPQLEQRVLGNFHNLFREIRHVASENENEDKVYQKVERYYTSLREATNQHNFNYYSMTLLVGLAQFWIIETNTRKNFLGDWFD